jgi:hypothetical protein
VKKTLLSALAVALLLSTVLFSTAGQSLGQDLSKPILTISLSGYKEIKSDLDFIGKLSGNPDMSKSLEGALALFTQGQGLAGLDESRPWGALIGFDGIQPQVLAFLPVSDMKKLLGALSGVIGEAKEVDGVTQIQAGPMPLFLKEVEGWAFISQSPEGLAKPPKDPTKLLGGLEKQYDVAVRLGVQNIPEAFRQLAIDQIKLGVEGGLQQQPNETDQQYEMRSKLTEKQMDALATMINELNEVTLGFSIDQQAHKMFFDFSMTAVAGSKTAKQFASSASKPSKMAGFVLPGAVASLHINSNSEPGTEDLDQVVAMFKTLRAQVENQIDKEGGLGDEQVKGVVKGVVAEVMDVIEATVKKGRMNGGAVVVGEGPFTAVAGGFVADGSKLEDAVKKLVDLAKNEPGFPEVKFNAETYKDVRFSTVAIPIPDAGHETEVLGKALGNPVQAVAAFGKESVFVAAGPKAIETIKQVIDASASGAEAASGSDALPPVQFTVSLGPIMKFAAQQDTGNPMLSALAEGLKGGKDHVSFTVKQISNGMAVRLEAEEGVLTVIGSAAKMATSRSGLDSLN